MFRSKRNALVKRLWKHRVKQQQQQRNSSGGEEDEGAGAAESGGVDGELEVKAVAYSMLKRLKEGQLELLVQAVESRGGDTSTCVSVPRGDVRMGRRSVAPHVLCCQLLRWPDLKQPFELKRLASCCAHDEDDPVYTCCNPYHWSRLCKPESPPPPYSRFAFERLKPEDRAPSEEPVSLETGGTNQYGSYSSQQTGGNGAFDSSHPPRVRWCNLAYWELRTRVGRLFPVSKPVVHVFSDLPHGDGLCLGALVASSSSSSSSSTTTTSTSSSTNHSDAVAAGTCEVVRRTRDKIGFGLTLSHEDDGVWCYNRSEHAIFVNSPTLRAPNSRTLVVYKVLPGYSIKIYDYDKSRYYQAIQDPEELDGPFDPNSVRISFAKGWGPKYSRQVITSCPCWLEVLLVPR